MLSSTHKGFFIRSDLWRNLGALAFPVLAEKLLSDEPFHMCVCTGGDDDLEWLPWCQRLAQPGFARQFAIVPSMRMRAYGGTKECWITVHRTHRFLLVHCGSFVVCPNDTKAFSRAMFSLVAKRGGKWSWPATIDTTLLRPTDLRGYSTPQQVEDFWNRWQVEVDICKATFAKRPLDKQVVAVSMARFPWRVPIACFMIVLIHGSDA